MGRQDLLIQERMKKLEALKKAGINPYISKFDVSHTCADIQYKYSKLKPEENTKDSVRVAGRLMNMRDLGKIAFGVLFDGSNKVQIVFQEGNTPEPARLFLKEYIDSGDIIGVEGTVFRTQRGEISVLVKSISILTKSLLPLPEKWHGIQDDEERLRKRYLDILMNPEIREMFIRKGHFWNSMRMFLISRGFVEVETPVLETSAGGASATPFATHHNALDLDVFLRISMGELWQKKLMVAGYPKTFEIGRQFRNEGMDAEHLQDYSQMEFYWAYANYKDGMELVEELYRTLAKQVYGKTVFTVGEHTFDLAEKWGTIDYADTIKKETGIDIFEDKTSEMEKTLNQLRQEIPRNADRVTLIDSLWKYCRKRITGPVFLTGQIVEVSPLAKRDSIDPRKTEHFQVIVGGSEVGHGYSELNDPIDQEQRFAEQQKLKDAGNAEAQSHDKDFVEALKYGMPPTCGFGVSERLFAFLEGKPIREIVIFPLMKPVVAPTQKKEKSEESEESLNSKESQKEKNKVSKAVKKK